MGDHQWLMLCCRSLLVGSAFWAFFFVLFADIYSVLLLWPANHSSNGLISGILTWHTNVVLHPHCCNACRIADAALVVCDADSTVKREAAQVGQFGLMDHHPTKFVIAKREREKCKFHSICSTEPKAFCSGRTLS